MRVVVRASTLAWRPKIAHDSDNLVRCHRDRSLRNRPPGRTLPAVSGKAPHGHVVSYQRVAGYRCNLRYRASVLTTSRPGERLTDCMVFLPGSELADRHPQDVVLRAGPASREEVWNILFGTGADIQGCRDLVGLRRMNCEDSADQHDDCGFPVDRCFKRLEERGRNRLTRSKAANEGSSPEGR